MNSPSLPRLPSLSEQVLETYWCGYSPSSGFTNCCENDSPTVSAMHAIFEKLLALPDTVTTPAQRAAWTAFSAIMPPLPLTNTSSGPVIAAAAVISSGSHNNEGPELYAIHPHRLFTVGRAVASGTNISLGVRTTMVRKIAENEPSLSQLTPRVCLRRRAAFRMRTKAGTTESMRTRLLAMLRLPLRSCFSAP